VGNEHKPDNPIAIEQLIAGLEELQVVLGEPARRAVPEVRVRLIEAMAARDRGDRVGALGLIGVAMAKLLELGDHLDPNEAALMHAVTDHFRTAVLRGDVPAAKQGMDVMLERSGSRERGKK